MKQQLVIAMAAFVFALLGLLLYRWQGSTDSPLMNEWGIVSFGFLGASFGCLLSQPGDPLSDWWS